jgi:hypothetical protein
VAAIKVRHISVWSFHKVFLHLLLLAGLATVVSWFAISCFSAARDSFSNAGLNVSERDLDFGTEWENPQFEWTITVENDTNQAILIDDFYASCHCLAITPRTLTIAPHRGQKISTQLLLQVPSDTERPEADFAVDLVPKVAGSHKALEGWTIRGKVRRALTAIPRVVNFGDSVVAHGPQPTNHVLVSPTVSLSRLEAECVPPLAAISIRRNVGNSYDIAVKPKEQLAPGALKFEIRLQPTVQTNVRLPDLSLPVFGYVSQEVGAEPATVLLGACQLGTVATASVRLVANDNSQFSVLGFKPSVPEVTIRPLANSSVHSFPFQIMQRVCREGDQSTDLEFSVQTSTTSLTVVQRIKYFGVARYGSIP